MATRHEFVIRPLKAADAATYRRCRLEQLEADPDAFGESVDEAASVPIDAIAARLGSAPEDGCVVGAFDGDALVGTAGWFRFRENKTCHKGRVWGVYITPAHRSRGLGRSLLKALVAAAGKAGVEQLTLSVAVTQAAARHLYASIGFEVIGREPRALKIGDRYVDEDLMLLRLATNDHDSRPRPMTNNERPTTND